jgi:ParB-like chromosome segregation protein Spo0J
MEITDWPIENLIEYINNPRKNDHAVDKIAAFIKEYGFRVPVIAKSDGLVVDGHLRLKAAKKLKMKTVPVVLADDLTDIQIRGLRIAINKSAEMAEWDMDLLNIEIESLMDDGFDIDLTGFDAADFDFDAGEPEDLDDDIPDDKYKEQHGVIVMCKSEKEQESVYEKLLNEGYDCKVVTT